RALRPTTGAARPFDSIYVIARERRVFGPPGPEIVRQFAERREVFRRVSNPGNKKQGEAEAECSSHHAGLPETTPAVNHRPDCRGPCFAAPDFISEAMKNLLR